MQAFSKKMYAPISHLIGPDNVVQKPVDYPVLDEFYTSIILLLRSNMQNSF